MKKNRRQRLDAKARETRQRRLEHREQDTWQDEPEPVAVDETPVPGPTIENWNTVYLDWVQPYLPHADALMAEPGDLHGELRLQIALQLALIDRLQRVTLDLAEAARTGFDSRS